MVIFFTHVQIKAIKLLFCQQFANGVSIIRIGFNFAPFLAGSPFCSVAHSKHLLHFYNTMMFRQVLLICACCFATALFAQKDTTFIEAHIDGLRPGWAKLVGTLGDQNYLIDSATIDQKGRFMLRKTPAMPAGYYYFLLPDQRNFSFLIDKDRKVVFRANVADIGGTIHAEGSMDAELFFETSRYQAKFDTELKQLAETIQKTPVTDPAFAKAKARQNEIVAERKTGLEAYYKKHPDLFFTKFKIAGQNPDLIDFRKPNGTLDTLRQYNYYRDHFFDGVDFADERLLYTPVVVNKLRRYMKELTPQHRDSLVKTSDALIRRVMPYKPYFKFFANWIALQYENTKTTVMDGEAVYVHIVKNFFTPELAYWSNPKEIEGLQKHVWEMEASLLGKKGPDVTAADVNGQMKSIYDMKAPLIVVFMFSPNCEHCQKDAPKVQQTYEKWKNRGVDFYGIALDTKDAEWKAFIKKNGFTFTNVYDPTNRAIYAKYFVDITPELYVLNKDRTIIAKNLHVEQLDEVFERELKKL